jgi:hypothetical protein
VSLPVLFSASEEISHLLWTQRFTAMFTRDCHWSYTEPNKSIPHPYTLVPSLISILILSSHLCLGLPNGLFPSGFVTKILYSPHLPHACYIPHPSHPWFNHPMNILWRVQIMNLIMQFCSAFSYFLPLRSKYFPVSLSTLFSNSLYLCSSFKVKGQVSHTYKTTGKTVLFYILSFNSRDRYCDKNNEMHQCRLKNMYSFNKCN